MEYRILKIDPTDNVGVATVELSPGTAYGVIGTRTCVCARDPVAFGHKIALVPLSRGEAVVKYGEVIGNARENIDEGRHIHTHNLDNLI